jgi:O-antigen/teichoic acid export membrane protein
MPTARGFTVGLVSSEQRSAPTWEGVALGRRTMRQHVARGTIVNGAFLTFVSALGMLKGLIVAGFLTPDEYGVWGILIISFGTFLWLRDVGVGDKYIQQEEEDQEAAFQKAFTLELIVTGAFSLLLLASVPLLALAYGRDDLIAPGLVLVGSVVISVLATPIWVFYRRMDFVRQRLLQSFEPVVTFMVTVALAVAGAGYWSLVLGAAAGAAVGGIVAVVASPYRLRLRYDRGTARSYVGFSWPLMAESGAGIVIAQGSVVAGNATLGAAGVGAIVLSSSISMFTDRVDGILTATLYPAICRLRDRVDVLLEIFVKSNRLALMWGIPFGTALTLFADDLVRFGLGDDWDEAVVLLQVFGVAAAAGHLGFNWTAFYRARGDTRPLAVVATVTMLSFLAVAVPLLATEGLDGFAWGIAVMTAVAVAGRAFYVARLFPGFSLARHTLRAIAPTIPAVLVVLAARALESGERTLGMALGELALYVVATVVATIAFERTLLREVMGYLRPSPAPKRALTTS